MMLKRHQVGRSMALSRSLNMDHVTCEPGLGRAARLEKSSPLVSGRKNSLLLVSQRRDSSLLDGGGGRDCQSILLC
jgi:hypothetical protein